MRPILHAAAIVALLAICFTICATGYQVILLENIDWIIHPIVNPDRYEYTHTDIVHRDAHFQDDLHQGDTLIRAKRQMETFEDGGDFSAPQQEDPGFWDRVVKVALKLFSKFVEWLNS